MGRRFSLTSVSRAIKARLYHSQPPGEDGQADAVYTLGICVQVQPPTEADIVVTKTVDDDDNIVDEGQTLIYTVTVSNTGPDDATEIVVDDLLPSDLTYVSDNPNQGTYNDLTGVWTVGDLSNGSSAILEITATVDSVE